MIVYNVTIQIENEVHDDWLEWMKNVHIPEVMNTGMFLENRMLIVLGSEESEGKTYSVQYICKSMKEYEQYRNSFAPALQEKHSSRYANKFVAFRTLLEVVK